MKSFMMVLLGACAVGGAASALSDQSKEEAIKAERKKYEGTWRIVALTINGNKAGEADARKLTVVNDAVGGWILKLDGNEVTRGHNVVDPTKKPKTIDFTPTEGEQKDKTYRGIYEIEANRRKLCFAPPDKDRPTEFASQPGSEHVLVEFEREKER